MQAEIGTAGTSNSFLEKAAAARQITACALYKLWQASYVEWQTCHPEWGVMKTKTLEN